MDDLYSELDLTPDCSFEDIKQRYRILAKIHHPDMGGDEEKFKRIKFAYEILIDPIRRSEYDKTGKTEKFKGIREEAVNILSQIVISMITNFDPEKGNLIELIKQDIRNTKERIIVDRNNCNVYISKLELVKSKIRKKNESHSEDIIFSFFDSSIDTKNSEMASLQRKDDIANEILKILDDYLYGYISISGNINHTSNIT